MWVKIQKSVDETICFEVTGIRRYGKKIFLMGSRDFQTGCIICESKDESNNLIDKILNKYIENNDSRIFTKIDSYDIILSTKEGLC